MQRSELNVIVNLITMNNYVCLTEAYVTLRGCWSKQLGQINFPLGGFWRRSRFGHHFYRQLFVIKMQSQGTLKLPPRERFGESKLAWSE